MRKHFVLGVAALLLATGAQAAERAGKVASVDASANTFTLQMDDGQRIVYKTSPSTRVTTEGASMDFADLAVGTRVEVTAPDVQDPALRIASGIEVVDAGATAGTTRPGEDAAARSESERQDRMAQAERDREDRMAQADPDADEADRRMARADRLPDTASGLPLAGLLGAGLTLAGLSIRAFRR
jgi:hypothetical protein